MCKKVNFAGQLWLLSVLAYIVVWRQCDGVIPQVKYRYPSVPAQGSRIYLAPAKTPMPLAPL